MRSSLIAGLLATTASGAAITRADIESCLKDSGVPYDVKGTEEYRIDSEAFNIRVPYVPAAIAVPKTTEHIQKAVLCGKKLNIKVSPKSGGHSYASLGFGGQNGNLVVQLDRMYNVSYDAHTKLAHVEPGTRLGHLAVVLYRDYKRSIAHGTCPGVGVSGHFAHGGFGFSSHRYGLALDQVEEVEVVNANGEVVIANGKENKDLFWAIRGAGSSFGIVSKWKLKTFESPRTLTTFGLALGWEKKETAYAALDVLEKYIENEAPKEINFRIGSYNNNGKHYSPNLEGLFYGNEAQLRKAIDPLVQGLKLSQQNVTIRVEENWLSMVVNYAYSGPDVDFTYPSARENFYAKSLALKDLHGASAKGFVDYLFDVAMPYKNPDWFFQLDMHGGKNSAISKVKNQDTAYPHRDKLYLIQLYDRVPNNATFPLSQTAFLDGWSDAVTKPLKADEWGCYANYADAKFDQATAQRLYYGTNLAKLQQIKAKYDPSDLFHHSQGIAPAK